MTSPRIHISYSDRHYHPERENRTTLWYSCSQIAIRFWKTLTDHFENVSYGNHVPDGSIDLLWTNRLNSWKPSVARMGYFASVAHHDFVQKQIQRSISAATHQPPEGLYTLGDRYKHWSTLERADLVLVIGNQRVLNSFDCHKNFNDKFKLANCGIDHSHFKSDLSKKSEYRFVYSATRFSVRKGSHILSKAWKLLEPKLPEARLLILGRDGDFDLRRELSECRNVEFIGAYKSGSRNYISKLNASKWVIFPSLAEGQAGTLLEAMSCGCIPLATRETGINADEYGGYVLEPNSSEVLCKMMEISYREWTVDQAQQVINTVKLKNDWQTFQEHILSYTQSLLAKKPRKHINRYLIIYNFVIHVLAGALANRTS